MKIKSIAAACLALCSVSAFAAPLNPNAPGTYATYYIAGASALAPAITNVVQGLNADGTSGTSQFFATPADVVKIAQSCPAAYTPNCDKVTLFFGVPKAGSGLAAGTNLVVIYNSADGSFAGMNQMANLGGAAAALADYSNITFNTDGTFTFGSNGLYHGYVPKLGSGLVLTGSGTSYTTTEQAFNGSPTVAGTPNAHFGFVKADIAAADVHAFENVTGAFTPGQGGFQTAGNITSKTIGLETFGIAVNPALYLALQLAEGLVPVGTAAPDLTTTKIPNIRSVDYASLIAQSSATKSTAQFLSNYQAGNTDAAEITIERRINLSGTQASSGIFFLDSGCGKGAANPTNAAVDSNPGIYTVVENSQTGDVTTALKATNTSGYALGIVSLEKNQPLTAASYNFVKLDGVSPNYSAAGVYDSKGRINTSLGNYKYAVEATVNFDKTNTNPVHLAFGTNLVNGLANSTLHNLVGISYLDGAVDTADNKQARFDHGGSTNCTPLLANQ